VAGVVPESGLARRLELADEQQRPALSCQGGPAATTYDSLHPHPVDRTTTAGRTALLREPVLIADVDLDHEYAYSGPRHYRAMLGVPVMVEDELIGIVVVMSSRPQILIGQRLFAAVEVAVETAPAGSLELKGFARPVTAYEVVASSRAPQGR
jgi:GAF domain-containing protein